MSTLAGSLRVAAEASARLAQNYRGDIATASADESPKNLMAAVHSLAAAETQSTMFTAALNVLEYNRGLPSWLTTQALQTADDTWSGRGNDLKRVIHDARIEALSQINDLQALVTDHG
jgi:hypothetical protein